MTTGFPRPSVSVVAIRRTVRTALPAVPFEKIARAILGPRYDLSLVVCGDSLARRMNATYRKKNRAANVLSFALAENEGEIFLNARKAAREARQFGVPIEERLARLFVHGCLHLKGFSHGRIMETRERRIMRRVGIPCGEKSIRGSTSARTTSRS